MIKKIIKAKFLFIFILLFLVISPTKHVLSQTYGNKIPIFVSDLKAYGLSSIEANKILNKYNLEVHNAQNFEILNNEENAYFKLEGKVTEHRGTKSFEFGLKKQNQKFDELTKDYHGSVDDLINSPFIKNLVKELQEKIIPRYSMYYLFSGLEKLHKGKLYESIRDFNQALTIDPQNINAYLFLGEAYIKTEKFDEAIGEYKKIISIDTNNILAHFLLAKAYYLNQPYELAKAEMEMYLKLVPQDKEAKKIFNDWENRIVLIKKSTIQSAKIDSLKEKIKNDSITFAELSQKLKEKTSSEENAYNNNEMPSATNDGELLKNVVNDYLKTIEKKETEISSLRVELGKFPKEPEKETIWEKLFWEGVVGFLVGGLLGGILGAFKRQVGSFIKKLILGWQTK